MTTMMDLGRMKGLLSDLDRHPERVQLHHGELESGILWLMDEIHRLAKTGEDDDRKMQLVAIEYRARLQRLVGWLCADPDHLHARQRLAEGAVVADAGGTLLARRC